VTKLENKSALVTGASRGIGRAIASALAQTGAHVLVHYGRSEQEARSLVASIQTNGGSAAAISADLGTPDGAAQLAEQVRSIVGARTVVGKPGLEDPSILAYAVTKGALETLVRNWAAILGPRGVRVNAVAPGVIDTDMSNFAKTEAGREATLGMQAFKRIGKPDDISGVVAFLASEDARWITGAHPGRRRFEALSKDLSSGLNP
jgi:3-oxoacyl-[acyl-carrier protein] reductase